MVFLAGEKVLYVPLHTGEDLTHKDVEIGIVSEAPVKPHLENQFRFVIFDTSGNAKLTPTRLLKKYEDQDIVHSI